MILGMRLQGPTIEGGPSTSAATSGVRCVRYDCCGAARVECYVSDTLAAS